MSIAACPPMRRKAMIDQERSSKVQLSCKRRDWAPKQTAPTERLSVDETLASLASPDHGTTPSRTVLVKNDARVAGAIGVQVWVDLPPDTGFSHESARSALGDAVNAVDRLARNRCTWLRDEFTAALTRWARAVTRPRDGESDHDGRSKSRSRNRSRDASPSDRTTADASSRESQAPDDDWSEPADVRVQCLSGLNVAFVSVDYRMRRSDGSYDEARSLRVVVGPDRYGIRFERRAGRRRMGDVQLPNQPCEFRLRAPARTLAEECADLRRQVAELETSAGAAITAPSAEAVRDLLSHRHDLLARRVDLEQRATALRTAHETLSSGWRKDAFDVDPDERQLLDRLDVGLEDLRTRLAEIPQLLLAASAWRQGERTERLSLIVAALVPPTLVAGVFGANVLPWAPTTDGWALVGMLLLMLASGALAMAVVAWVVLDRYAAATKRGFRRSSMLVGLVVLALGTGIAGCVVLDRGTAGNRPEEEQAVVPATTTRSEERAGSAVSSAPQR